MKAHPISLLFPLLILAACRSGPDASRAKAPADASPAMVMEFISDDYAAALAEARARHVPLFIEAWAPW